MWKHNLNEEQIVIICFLLVIGAGFVYCALEAMKQKAFMKGFKLGRSITQWNHTTKGH
jgi:pyrroline-5-carboxylate reductase